MGLSKWEKSCLHHCPSKHTDINTRNSDSSSSDVSPRYASRSRPSLMVSICSRYNLSARRKSSVFLMKSPSTLNVLFFLHGTSLVTTSVITKQLSSFRTFVTRALTGYTLQRTTKAWIALALAAHR